MRLGGPESIQIAKLYLRTNCAPDGNNLRNQVRPAMLLGQQPAANNESRCRNPRRLHPALGLYGRLAGWASWTSPSGFPDAEGGARTLAKFDPGQGSQGAALGYSQSISADSGGLARRKAYAWEGRLGAVRFVLSVTNLWRGLTEWDSWILYIWKGSLEA